MSWKCDLDINEVDVIQVAPVVADDILNKLDTNHKGWEYDPVRGYSFSGDVRINEDVVKDGRLTIKFHKVGGHFLCHRNRLTSLEGCPESVGGTFWCDENQLTSLKGCPEIVGGTFSCGCNQLTSLEGCPKTVSGDFGCGINQLTSLEGCPKSVGGDFICGHNQLTSLKGSPKKVGGYFDCRDNKVEFTEKDVTAVCEVKNEICV